MIELAIMLIVVGSSLWVLFDASRIGARPGLLAGAVKTGTIYCDYGPGGWFALCLLIWIIAFPAYLANRDRIIDAASRPASAGEIMAVTGKRVLGGNRRPVGKWRDPVDEWESRQSASGR